MTRRERETRSGARRKAPTIETVEEACAILDAIGLRPPRAVSRLDLAAMDCELDAIAAEMRRRGFT